MNYIDYADEKESMRRNVIAALFSIETTAPAETAAVGRRLMAELESGDIVALIGELGSGKTQFVKGACVAAGIPEEQVTSPTFTIVQEYTYGQIPIYHFDAYRVEHVEEFHELGYEEYFFGDGICFIEWPEKVAPLIPEDALIIQIEHRGDDKRRLHLLTPTEEGNDDGEHASHS